MIWFSGSTRRIVLVGVGALTLACGSDEGGDTTAIVTSGVDSGLTAGTGTADTGGSSEDSSGADGDGSTGDGDGASAGDGDGTGTGDGDGTTGDGTTGDGDGTTTGDGDGTTAGDGDGTTAGDGDGTTGDGDGTTTAGDGDGTATGDGDGACQVINLNLAPEPPNVLLTVDVSGSMVNTALYWDHDLDAGTPTVSRWESAYNIINFIVTNFNTTMNLGISFFPELDGSHSCGIANPPEVSVQPNGGPAILAALPPASEYTLLWTNPTPTVDALQIGADHLRTYDPTTPRAMILMTDGIPACTGGYPEAIQVVSQAYQNDDIPTYVVGFDIQANVFGDFNDLAIAGGVPQTGGTESFYNATSEIDLQNALNQIASDVASCVINLTPEPGFPDLTKVFVDGTEWPRITDCATQNGWYYTVQYSQMELCGTACDALQVASTADIEYHCQAG